MWRGILARIPATTGAAAQGGESLAALEATNIDPLNLRNTIIARQRSALERALAARREAEAEFGYDVMDNFAWREITVIDTLNRVLGTSLTHLGGRRGPDATSERWQNVSIKTSTIKTSVLTDKSGRVEFQRQTEQKYRNDALNGYQAIAFALFRKNTADPLLTLFVSHPRALAWLRAALYQRQRQFLERTNPTRDSLQLPFRQLYAILDGVDYELIAFGERIVDKPAFLKRLQEGGIIIADD